MDSVGVASKGGNKCRVNKRNRDGHKRLLLRKTADQPPTMQSKDKHRPKKIAEEWERNTVWPSSKKPPQAAQQSQQKTNDSGNTLRFTCCQCGDSLEYVPKDLVRHFEEKHRGSPPVFSCHMCTFSTHEFSYLQVHLLSHKDTFSGCSICKDNVQRTWPEFSAHLTMCHRQNGKYSCVTCPKFSTGDVGVYLEHTYAHSLAPEGANDDLHTKDRSKFGVRTVCQTLHCQHCGHETSRKLFFNKDLKAVHVCPSGNRRKTKKEEGVHSVAMKPNDPVPKVKPRLTRSAVREMCWLTQDCLSLPGREFLDKYCHLSDPQTTLEETQQFLMKSVAGETADQKWTKALKSVLSNVPQDVMSENDLVSNSSDVTVLTVKNKITVAQNGAKYAKKLKMMTSSEKEAVSPGNVPGDAHGVVAQDECQSNLNDHGSCPQAETKLHTESSLPGQSVPSESTQIQENRENRDLKNDQEMEECSKNHEDGINISRELKLINESKEQPFIHKDIPRNRRRSRRRKRKARSKRAEKRSAGLPLKIVLKKNPVKEKQWVSQSSLPPSGGGPTDQGCEETPQILPHVLQTAHQRKWTKASKTDPSDPTEAVGSIPPLKPGGVTASGASKPAGLKNNEPGDGAESALQFLDTDADMSESAGRTGRSDSGTAEKIQLQTPGSTMSCHAPDNQGSSAADGATALRTYSKSSPVSQPVITPQGKTNSEDLSLAVSSEQSVESMRGREVPADAGPDILSDTNLPTVKAIQQEPSPAPGQDWQPVPKTLERTLKLVAISPYQLVKHPVGDQPVVVLNHPDADIPEVARIMEVVNRYGGEVQKVVLSQSTVNALLAMNGEVPTATDPTDSLPHPRAHGKNCVQERFMLKLKLRRLSRKKYEVVGAVSPSKDPAPRFRCWFCGRVLACQEAWVIHRQRHLMEWNTANCENSEKSHTLD